jgi:hypothetical protein
MVFNYYNASGGLYDAFAHNIVRINDFFARAALSITLPQLS